MRSSRIIPFITCVLYVGGGVAAPSNEGYHRLDRRVGCPDGGYLIYSTATNGVTNTFCLGNFAAAGIVWGGIVLSGTAITYLKNAWNNGQCAAPVSLTAPTSSSSSDMVNLIGGADASTTVTSYGFEITKGYEDHTCTNTLTNQNWGDAVQAITQYMVDYDDECAEVVVRGDNGFEANTVTWIVTADGTNHKTCG